MTGVMHVYLVMTHVTTFHANFNSHSIGTCGITKQIPVLFTCSFNFSTFLVKSITTDFSALSELSLLYLVPLPRYLYQVKNERLWHLTYIRYQNTQLRDSNLQ